MNYWLLLIPIISTFLGWLGLRVAGQILVHKIIPSRREELSRDIGKTVSDSFSFTDIENKISDPANIKSVMPVVEEHVDDFLRNKLKAKMPVVGMFIGDKTITSLKEVFLKEIEDLFPQVLKGFTGNLKKDIDIEAMVAKKITTVSGDEIAKALDPALRYFSLAGAITGFVIGCANLLTLYLIIK